MSTWTEISEILKNLETIIGNNVAALSDQIYSHIMPGLAVQNNPSTADLKRVIMGTKSYDDMKFPQCHIIPVNINIETITSGQERFLLNVRIVALHEDSASLWGGSLRTMELSCHVKDALYKALAGQRTRTLGGACNDIFVTEITLETEPLRDTTIHWNYIQVQVRKHINSVQ